MFNPQTHTQPATGKGSAIKIPALHRFITEELCACSYPAANAKETMQGLNHPRGDFCVVFSQEHLMSSTKVCWWEQFLKHSSSSIYIYPYVLLQVLAGVAKEGVIAVGKDK